MKEFVRRTVCALVEHPDAIEVTEVTGRQTSILEVGCHASDLRRLIGRGGKTAGALRILAGAVAARRGRKAVLEVAE